MHHYIMLQISLQPLSRMFPGRLNLRKKWCIWTN